MKQSRLKTVWFFGIIISFLCFFAINKNMEGVSTVLALGVAGIVGKYNNDETKRPSEK